MNTELPPPPNLGEWVVNTGYDGEIFLEREHSCMERIEVEPGITLSDLLSRVANPPVHVHTYKCRVRVSRIHGDYELCHCGEHTVIAGTAVTYGNRTHAGRSHPLPCSLN